MKGVSDGHGDDQVGAPGVSDELDPEDGDTAFGLCDLGLGMPELGSVRLSELSTIRGPLGLPVERDLHFISRRTLSEYAALARDNGSILD